MKRGAIIFILMIILLSNFVSGADYYMAIDGSDSNEGSYDAPWASLNRAFQTLQAGDTLIIKNGTYTGDFNSINHYNNYPNSGNSNSWITFKAES